MTDLFYKIDGKSLAIQGPGDRTARCTFAFSIASVVAFPSVLVVRIEPPEGIRHNENVYGVRADGSIAWQVPPREYVYDDSPFTGMTKCGDAIKLMNWDGLELVLDPISGQEISETYGR